MSSEPEPVVATVSELKPSMRNISIVFKVLEMTEAREVTSREDGKTHKIVDAKVGDKTGTVIVPLWDDAIERVQVGSTYKLENGYTGLFRSNLRLNVGRYGVISAATEEIGDVDTSNDVSAVEHERQYRVRTPIVVAMAAVVDTAAVAAADMAAAVIVVVVAAVIVVVAAVTVVVVVVATEATTESTMCL
jgi:replication factor A1